MDPRASDRVCDGCGRRFRPRRRYRGRGEHEIDRERWLCWECWAFAARAVRPLLEDPRERAKRDREEEHVDDLFASGYFSERKCTRKRIDP